MSNTIGNFIVVFKEGTTKEEVDKYADEVNRNGGEVKHRFDLALNGFSAAIPDAFLQSLQQSVQAGDSPIDYIEPDGVVTTQ